MARSDRLRRANGAIVRSWSLLKSSTSTAFAAVVIQTSAVVLTLKASTVVFTSLRIFTDNHPFLITTLYTICTERASITITKGAS